MPLIAVREIRACRTAVDVTNFSQTPLPPATSSPPLWPVTHSYAGKRIPSVMADVRLNDCLVLLPLAAW